MEESIRLDKYLKISRIIKRRTVAQQAASGGKVLLNGKPAKSSASVKVGDIITVQFGQRPLTVRVKAVRSHATKEDAADMYEVL